MSKSNLVTRVSLLTGGFDTTLASLLSTQPPSLALIVLSKDINFISKQIEGIG